MAPISIQLQLNGEAPKLVTLSSDFTLNEFQETMKKHFGDSSWMYTYVCHGKSFELKDNNEINRIRELLVPGMTLFLYTRVKGSGMNAMGSKFADVSNRSKLKKAALVSTGPDWLTVRPGLSLEGKCANGKCQAYKEMVIINIGIKRFDLNSDKRLLSKCPQCQSYVNPITCGFYRCQWRYEGQIQRNEDDEPTPHSSEWKKADDAYYYFDSNADESVNWIQLILEAKPL